jgi:hypothetical protein
LKKIVIPTNVAADATRELCAELLEEFAAEKE